MLLGMDVNVHVFDSGRVGPALLVFGGIHGNETCGPDALLELESELRSGQLQLERGRLTLVPICNPKAHAANVRYIEENLNRVFEPTAVPSSYEQRLAQILCPLLESCDAFLDLHSMHSQGDPFVFLNEARPESLRFCENVGVSWILRGWPELYRRHPELLSCCTQSYADRFSKPNALVECGIHGHPDAVAVARKAVRHALGFYGLISMGPSHNPAPIFRHVDLKEVYIRHSLNDSFSRVWRNFEPYKKGEVLATRANGEAICASSDGVMILPSPASAVGTEWFYTGVLLG